MTFNNKPSDNDFEKFNFSLSVVNDVIRVTSDLHVLYMYIYNMLYF